MARPSTDLRRGLVLWIAVLLLGGVAGAVTQPAARDTAVVAGGPTDGTPATRDVSAPVTTALATTSTTTPAPTTTEPPVTVPPTTTTTRAEAPSTTTAPTTTAPAAPTFSMTPAGAVSSSAGDHYMLSGNGCSGQRVTLRVHGGQFDGDLADYATPAADGAWGIGFMVAIPGNYELRAACTTADWVAVFEYQPVPFTILP
jgi:hypothetical protein